MSRALSRLTADGRPIAARLRRLIFALWTLLLLLSAVSIAALHSQTQDLSRLTLVVSPALDANRDGLQAMTDAQSGLLGYQSTRDVTFRASYRGATVRAAAAFSSLRAKLEQMAADDQHQALAVRLESSQEGAAVAWRDYARRSEQSAAEGKAGGLEDGSALFERFRVANAELGGHIRLERDRLRAAALESATRHTVMVVGACLAALILGLLGGNWAARSFSRPIGELRLVLRRQREGDRSARARVDQGAFEVRSLAGDFNALTEQNELLHEVQARGLSMNNLTFEIARAIRAAPDTQATLDVICQTLGPGLGVDRVMANTVDADHKVMLGAQWQRPELHQLGDIASDILPHVGQLAEELWRSSERLTLDDLLAPKVNFLERAQIFHRETGARGLMIIPIGLGDRVIGMIYVITVHEPHHWTESEASTVQQVAGFVARAVVQADQQAHQSEYVERLVGLDRQKSDFLATVSHELRTPLTSISGYLEMLQDRDAGELTAEQEGMLEVMQRNTTRLGGLIEDLLILNRIESDVKADVILVSLREVIIDAQHELSPFALRAAVALDIDAGQDEAIVQGDRGSLHRAIINIVSNAIKFSPPGSTVTIRCSLDKRARRVRFACLDRGIGIPAADQRNLFRRFFRASNATAQAIPGTGLGLSIVKQIVEDHGGELRISSVEGDGTEVIMDLPLWVVPVAPRPVGNDSHATDVFGIRA